MSLQQKIYEDLKLALKNKDESKLSTLRMLKSEIQYELTKTGSSEIPDDKVIAILKKSAKTRQETSEEYKKANRPDLSAKEDLEAQIILSYIPKGPTNEEIEQYINSLFSETPPKSINDVGRFTGKVMQKYKGQNVDGSLVSTLVKSRIEAFLK